MADIEWELIEQKYNTKRLKVHGGWLVSVMMGTPYPVFVSDPDHEWKIE